METWQIIMFVIGGAAPGRLFQAPQRSTQQGIDVGIARLSVLALAVSISVACASAAPTLSERFVRQGKPAMDVGGPKLPKMRSVDRRALVSASEAARPPAPVLPSLESTDPDLRAALTRLLMAPTAANYLDVSNQYLRHGVFDRADDFLNRSLAANGPDASIYDARARLWRDWGNRPKVLAMRIAPCSWRRSRRPRTTRSARCCIGLGGATRPRPVSRAHCRWT